MPEELGQEPSLLEKLKEKNFSPKEIAEKLYTLNPSLTHISHEIIESGLPIDALYEAISTVTSQVLYNTQAEDNVAKLKYHMHEIREKYDQYETDQYNQKEFRELTGLLLRGRSYFREVYNDVTSAGKKFDDYCELLAYKGIEYHNSTFVKKDLHHALSADKNDDDE